MKAFNINEVGEKFDISKPTIRYYEQEGLIPNIKRNKNGVRIFSTENINMIQSIECLKKTGMPIREIKSYANLIEKGDSTLNERLEIFNERKQEVESQIEKLNKTLKEIEWKQKYYQQAIADGTEKYVKQQVENEE